MDRDHDGRSAPRIDPRVTLRTHVARQNETRLSRLIEFNLIFRSSVDRAGCTSTIQLDRTPINSNERIDRTAMIAA